MTSTDSGKIFHFLMAGHLGHWDVMMTTNDAAGRITEGALGQSEAMPRLVNRVMLECMLAGCEAAGELAGRDFETGILLTILARETQSAAQQGPEPLRGVSVNALAASFGRPFETVRRRVNRLIKLNLCARHASGVVLAASNSPEAMRFLERTHDYTLRLIEDLRALDYPVPDGDGTATSADIICGGLNLLGQLLDIAIALHSDWTGMHLFYAIMIANARNITYDPGLAYRYAQASTPPPETVRVPVSARALSRGLIIPYPTIRRSLARMEDAGQIHRIPGGWMLTPEWMQKPEMIASGHQVARKLSVVLSQFARAGFPMRDPASRYLHGRPSLISFA